MSRGLTTAAATAVQQEVVLRTCAVALDFPGGWVRVNGSPASIVIDDQEYLGVGVLGGISEIEESAEARSRGITLRLAGVPRDAVALALTEAYQNRPGLVFEVVLDRVTWRPIDVPILIFRGRMDQMAVLMGDRAVVEVTLEDRLTDWDRPALRRYTDEDQKRQYASDRGFEFVPAVVEKDVTWPARSFKK